MTIRLFILLSVLPIEAYSQNISQLPVETYVGPHRIGETFTEWLSGNQIDHAQICEAGKQKQKTGIDYKTACRALSGIEVSGAGHFATVDEKSKRPFLWSFVDHRVARAETSHDYPNTTQEVRFLTDAYGPPQSTETVKYQNDLGAKWECLEATWLMGDGAVIRARESMKNTPRPTPWLTVTFYSKDEVDRLVSKPISPNPYK